MGNIRINQMGYLPGSLKELAYIGEEDKFTVVDADENQSVYAGKLTEPRLDESSLDNVRTGDFTAVNKPGNYFIKIGNENSMTFSLSDKQNEICTDALLKGLYYQRCGVELTKEYAGPWHHPICHLQPAYVFCGEPEKLLAENPGKLEMIDTEGGWHDAGDYGRYTVASVKTIADLLLAYEFFKDAFEHPINIPESRLKGADILHEARVGLDFLFKLQRESDGSVYTKVATRYFPGMIMPDEDINPLFVFDTSSPATAGFAAVMAMASRAYIEFDPVYAGKCLSAAKKAYLWLTLNPEPKLFKNPPDITSGEYGDNTDLDERYFAAAQMYRATGEETYHSDFLFLCFKLDDRMSLGWKMVGGYGTIGYLFSKWPVNEKVYDALKKEWLLRAGQLEKISRKNGYGITLSLNQYIWGSNMLLLNQSMHLIIADRLLGNTKYDSVISHNWDYIFGRNPMDISYVTGLGERSIKKPHHRPSAADGVDAPIPGLLSGGPCDGLLDRVVRDNCQGNPPAKCFMDHFGSFSTNEIDTYWNSVGIFVGAYLCDK